MVVQCGFFPGLSHFKRARHNPDVRFQSLSVYPENTRSMMRTALAAMRVEPAVQADHPMVEAHLLQSPDCDLLVLANWSGAARPVVVTLRNGVAYARAEAVRATDAKLDGPSGSRAVSLTLGPGDFVRLFR